MARVHLHALILAGGKGTRLSCIVNSVPKPMALINGVPFLEYQIRLLTRHGIRAMTILTGYMHHVIENYFQDGSKFGCNITYSREDSPLGTGGALAKAIESRMEPAFLVVNGDSFFNINLRDLLENWDGISSIVLYHCQNPSRYGIVEIGSDYIIRSFVEKNMAAKSSGYINSGIYILNRFDLKAIPSNTICSLESQVFPLLTMQERLKGIPMAGSFIDIGVPEDYARAQFLIPNWFSLEEKTSYT